MQHCNTVHMGFMGHHDQSEPNGRVRLLDSAERLFAKAGYDGASLRAITRDAGVEVGLSGYHFRSKDELFRQVLQRRAPEMSRALGEALEAALFARHGGEQGIRSVLHAYVEPHLDRLHSADEGWRSYIRLAAFSALFLDRPELLAPATKVYEPVMKRFRTALGELLPNVLPAAVDRYYYVFQMAILSIAVDSVGPVTFVETRQELTSRDEAKDELIEAIVDIYTAGFVALDDARST